MPEIDNDDDDDDYFADDEYDVFSSPQEPPPGSSHLDCPLAEVALSSVVLEAGDEVLPHQGLPPIGQGQQRLASGYLLPALLLLLLLRANIRECFLLLSLSVLLLLQGLLHLELDLGEAGGGGLPAE